MTLEETELRDIEEIGKLAQGKNELIKYLKGGKLSALQAIKAYCYWCNGYCSDGKEICEEQSCALWPHNPYTPKGKRVLTEKQRLNVYRLTSRAAQKKAKEEATSDFKSA
jgi:hypothetical protein